jgi:D-alanyl-lipoteichoic acid acyltransferase DltB (MBOAT superfamily)
MRAYRRLGLTALVALTLWFRGELPAVGVGRMDRAVTLDLAFLGLSYAFLRAARAILAPRAMRPAELARYWFFAPTFFSGPVTEPALEPQAPRRPGRADLEAGLGRILLGVIWVGASFLLSPVVPLAAPESLGFALERWSAPVLWGGVFASGVWLYLNFAGFSEIFIGLARAWGEEVPENFARPYAATNLTDFWQRWHMSLGSWLRATVYGPLALRGASAALVAPVITMLVSGLWHGVEAAFVLWGLLHGLGLALHQAFRRGLGARLSTRVKGHRGYRASAWVLTHGFVTGTWVLLLPFRGVDLGLRLRALGALFGVES